MEPEDNVAVVTAETKAGDVVQIAGDIEVRAAEAIPRGGKVALAGIAAGEPVIRYGEPIGLATEDIEEGQHVHTHNLGAGA